MVLLLIVLSLLAPVLIAVLFLPTTLQLFAKLVGNRLRRSSSTRRELLLARVAKETKQYEAERQNRSREDDDWENVVPSPADSTVNGGTADSEWDGIVGFFHPFWYETCHGIFWAYGC
jgi:alpha-1,2-mannosyltransferase